MKSRPRIAGLPVLLCLVMCTLCFAPSGLFAQGTTATVEGTVSDASGAAVPDASVVVRNLNTGAANNASTDSQGRYLLADIGVGEYEIRVTKAGFSNSIRRGVTLTVGSRTVVDFALRLGQATETITVQAEASQVETTNATVASLTDQQQVHDLPLNGRNLEQLIQLAPGVNTLQGNAFIANGFLGRAPEYSIAGGRPEGQGLFLDDESIQNFWNKGMSSVTGSSLGVEAIGEFQTLTNTYSAQFGGNGGVINAVSKSGTNGFHGSAYEYLRNSALDARRFIDPSTIPPFRKNQFGGTIGGPIKKDKMFFFANYEGVRQLLGETYLANVPGCNLNPASCTPAPSTSPSTAQAIANTLAIFPNPTQITNGQPQATMVGNQTAAENYVLARFDYNISSKDTFFARYISSSSNFTEPFGGGGFGGGTLPYWPEYDTSHLQFTTIEWRRLISPNMVNTAHASFSRPSTYEYQLPTTGRGIQNGSDPLAHFGGPDNSGRPDAIVNIAGLAGMGSALQLPFNTTQNRYTAGDDVTWTHGAHNVRFGADVSRLQSNTFMPFFAGSMWVFTGLSQFVTGVPAAVIYVPLGSYPNRDFRQTDFTPYIQDDWKVSSKVTLNLGFRWAFISNPTDAHNQLFAITNFATAANTASTPSGFTHVSNVMANNPSLHNFDPRVGIAFDPFSDHKTSIRAGFGIFHQPISVSDYAPGYWTNWPWVTNVVPGALGAVYPNLPNGGRPAIINVGHPSSTPAFDYYTDTTPYMIQYNLNIQREVAKNTVVSVGYVGSRGVHLVAGNYGNPPLTCSTPHCASPQAQDGPYFGYGTPGNVTPNGYLNSYLGGFPQNGPYAWSQYNSLQTSVNRRFTSNFQAQASYVLSKCMTDAEFGLGAFNANSSSTFMDPYNSALDKSVCSYDQHQVVRFNGTYALPFHQNWFAKGWQFGGIVSYNTGYPLNITTGYDEATGGSLYALAVRPNVNPGFSGNPVVGKVNEWYNPAAFSMPAPGTLGNLGRNAIRGPNFADADFSVLKRTPVPKISEAFNIEFRAEFFNVFNHVNLGLPGAALFNQVFTSAGPTYGSLPTAGLITTQVATPRQIQFALKLLF